jgi:DNA-binding beta-propeller fold protein YncE
MHRRTLFALLSLVLTLFTVAPLSAQDTAPTPDSQFAADPQYPAPDFAPGLDWVNVEGPLTMADLRGKVVVMDFWTYGCINCIHMIPTLRRLEEKYGDALVVVGVHSAKFDNEGETRNIQQIVQRYDVHHPVINDSDFIVWRTFQPYGVNAWPTFVLIDPRGNILAVQAGEIPFDAFDRVIGGMVAYFDSVGEIDRTPLPLAPEGAGNPANALSFPGKVLVDAAGNRLFIADTNNNRIVVADLTSYEVLDVIGVGVRGFDDGSYDTATFNQPQGMTLTPDGNTLYVADVENHAIRAVDLSAEQVTTIAGTGEQAYARNQMGAPLETAISSPWDVFYNAEANVLHIAMAGPHQLWALDFDDNIISPQVGSGREGLVEGAFRNAELAQPSGLHLDGDRLYFADSESSSIRVADLSTETTATVAGPLANDLFTFGDVDGEVGTSRLQHPLGVTGDENGLLYIADTYNSRIKRIDPATNITTTLYGVDDHGFRDGNADAAAFYEPGGLDYADGRLYVADTNNHAIRVIDLAAGDVSTVVFPNPQALQMQGQITVAGSNRAMGDTQALDAQTVAAGDGELILRIVLPEGYKINPDAPSMVEWTSSGDAVQPNVTRVPFASEEVRVPVALSEGEATLSGYVNAYYCEAVEETLCYLDEVTVSLPVVVSADGEARELVIERAVTPPVISVGRIGE